MNILGIVLMWVLLAVVVFVANKCFVDKDSDGRQAYWDRYEK